MTPLPHGPVVSARQWRLLIASVVVAGVGYLAFSMWAGWHDVQRAAVQVGWHGAVVLLALSALNYGLRFLRWQLYLRALGHAQPWRPSLAIYIAGFGLTTTPGKVGEAVRSLFLKARGMDHATSMAAFVSERLSDLVAVALLCALGWNLYPPLRPFIGLGLVATALPLLLIAQARLLSRWQAGAARREGRLARGLAFAAGLLLRARACHRPRLLLVSTLLSVMAWSAEAFGFWLLLGWLGSGQSLAFAAFSYAVAMVAGALSFLPGGLGGAEATMTAMLIASGSTHAVAVSATVFIRITTLWFAVALGAVALMRILPGLSTPRPQREAAVAGA